MKLLKGIGRVLLYILGQALSVVTVLVGLAIAQTSLFGAIVVLSVSVSMIFAGLNFLYFN